MVVEFPFEIFDPYIAQSFKDLAEEYSIPPQFMGSSGLFTVAALSGNMYQTELNGSIKNIIFSMLVGPSGAGKTPSFDLLCGNVIAPLNSIAWARFEENMKDWQEAHNAAKAAKTLFDEPEPTRVTRIASGGTTEGMMANAMAAPAGFGLYYDEGGEMLGTPNQYKKETSSVDFWNKMWNGKSFNELRADKSRERYVPETSLSALVGMQTDRVQNYFSSDTILSGLPFRFLVTMSDMIPLNENVDPFNPNRRQVCDEWRSVVRYLYESGCTYTKESRPFIIPFTDAARRAYTGLCQRLIRKSNKLRFSQKSGDSSSLMVKYETKLFAYAGRFLIPLAIMDNKQSPLIQESHVHKAELLYNFYHSQALILFNTMVDDDLNENERLLLESLPDEEFGTDDIERACLGLKLHPTFFHTVFRRKYRNGFIKRVSRGVYIKEI